LLRQIAAYQRPVILSAGVATVQDIAEAIDTVTAIQDSAAVTILHCITAYPAPEEEYNLRVLPALRRTFGVATGVSDHSLDPVLVPALATVMGATMIEKHITLSRRDAGLDDPIALEPGQFRRMVTEVSEISVLLDEARRESTLEFHRKRIEIEDALKEQYGEARVERVLGTGIKELAPSEERNYGFTNRSIHALRDVREGGAPDRGEYGNPPEREEPHPGAASPFLGDDPRTQGGKTDLLRMRYWLGRSAFTPVAGIRRNGGRERPQSRPL
jgi:sialic acid synthase SpsE